MIAGSFWNGSGLGNQLHRYVATRILANDLNVDFGMLYPENFKGQSFMNLDMGKKVSGGAFAQEGDVPSKLPRGIKHYYRETKVEKDGIDIRPYDTEIYKVEDKTLIEGEFQDEKYWRHREGELREWLKVEPLEIDDDTCVINFRGGEYKYFPDLYLTQDYWDNAIDYMRKDKGIKSFFVVTDDPLEARKFFPKFEISHEIGLDWRAIRFAKSLILSNSSFGILPAWLNEEADMILAPMYWARRNKGVWALPQNQYSRFTYL